MKINIELDLEEIWESCAPRVFGEAHVKITSEDIEFHSEHYDSVWEALCAMKAETGDVILKTINYIEDNRDEIRSRIHGNNGKDDISSDEWKGY